jgi:hypothetical protein
MVASIPFENGLACITNIGQDVASKSGKYRTGDDVFCALSEIRFTIVIATKSTIKEYNVIIALGAANSHQVLLLVGEILSQIRYGTEAIKACAMELLTGIFAVNSHGMCVSSFTVVVDCVSSVSPPDENTSLNAGWMD